MCDSSQQQGGLARRGASVFDSNLRRSREGRRSPFNFRCRLPLDALPFVPCSCPLLLTTCHLPPGCFFAPTIAYLRFPLPWLSAEVGGLTNCNWVTRTRRERQGARYSGHWGEQAREPACTGTPNDCNVGH